VKEGKKEKPRIVLGGVDNEERSGDNDKLEQLGMSSSTSVIGNTEDNMEIKIGS